MTIYVAASVGQIKLNIINANSKNRGKNLFACSLSRGTENVALSACKKCNASEMVKTIQYRAKNKEMVLYFINANVSVSLRRLKEISELNFDWNGYGATPFSPDLIEKCRRIVKKLTHQPQIFPTGRQSVQFQFELQDRSYLEFEIFEDRTLCLMVPKRIYENATELVISDSEEKRIKGIVVDFYGECGTEK